MRSIGGSRGRLNQAAQGSVFGSQFDQLPGTRTPAGFIGRARARIGQAVAYNTMLGHPVGRSFPGEGSEDYPAERNNITPRVVRRRPEPHTTVRLAHGADIDPAMAALTLGLPWRPAPDSPPARPGGPGTHERD